MTPQGSPIFEHTAQMPNEKRAPETVCSYLSVHEALAKKSKMYSSKYAQFVIDYTVEWERVVVARVTAALKKAEQLRVETDHYQEKVETLRQSANSSMAKGKMVDPKAAERLSRNEEKLASTKKVHDKFTSDLCILLDEITDRSWRDLHPLLVKMAQFDMTLSDDESKSLTILNGIVNSLKTMANEYGIKPQARLKDLDSLDPNVLSTRKDGSGGNNALGATDPLLAIEALSMGGDTSSVTSGLSKDSQPAFPSLTSDLALPPGSVLPQSSGGFPVMVQNSTGTGTASGSGLSTLDMLTIQKSSAPAPTLDQLNDTFAPGGVMTPSSAFSSGTMPLQTQSHGRPAPAGRGVGRNYSSESFSSGYSTVSEASAPPPFAPPPPPPGSGAAPPNPFGAPPPPAAPNPFGAGPPATTPAPHSFGSGMSNTSYGSAATPPPGQMYGNTMARAPPPPQQQPYNNYGMAPPPAMAPQTAYGQPPPSMYPPQQAPPPLSMYGAPPSQPAPRAPASGSTNPFDN